MTKTTDSDGQCFFSAVKLSGDSLAVPVVSISLGASPGETLASLRQMAARTGYVVSDIKGKNGSAELYESLPAGQSNPLIVFSRGATLWSLTILQVPPPSIGVDVVKQDAEMLADIGAAS